MSEQRDNRNAVFTSPPGQQAVPSRSSDDLIDNVEELVPLPSGGVVYPVGSSLHGRTVVEIKGMTTVEENILTNPALAKKGTVLSELIKSCLSDKSINPADLIVGDRYALLVAIRITGYGHIYRENITCSECDAVSQREFDLSKFPIKTLDIEPVAPGQNVFQFCLPRSGKLVEFRFMTGRDEEEMHVIEARSKKLGLQTGGENVTSTLLRTIVSVNGVSDPSRIAAFIRSMNAGDSLALRSYMGEHSPGIKMEQTTTCVACGHEEVTLMPVGMSFLWPSLAGKQG